MWVCVHNKGSVCNSKGTQAMMYFYYEQNLKGQLCPVRSIHPPNAKIGEVLVTVQVHGKVHQIEGEDETMPLADLSKKYPPQ